MKAKIQFIGIACLLVFSIAQSKEIWRTCIAVIDGDTIVLDGKEKVRLIGVDTPETKDPRKPPSTKMGRTLKKAHTVKRTERPWP